MRDARSVGVIVVTHGELAEKLVDTAGVIVGDTGALRALSLDWDDAVDSARERVRSAIQETDQGHGVLVLTDLFGGTPSNLCISFLDEMPVEVVTGVNLPMVVKTVNLARELAEELSLRDLADRVAKKARDSIVVASSMLEPEEADDAPAGGQA